MTDRIEEEDKYTMTDWFDEFWYLVHGWITAQPEEMTRWARRIEKHVESLLTTQKEKWREEIEQKVVELFLDFEMKGNRVEHTDVVAIVNDTLSTNK